MPVSSPSISGLSMGKHQDKPENSIAEEEISPTQTATDSEAELDDEFQVNGSAPPVNIALELVKKQFLAAPSMSTGSENDGVEYVKSLQTLDSDKPIGRRLNEIFPKTSVSFHRNLADVNCDPERPRTLQFQQISYAAFKIQGGIVKTPCTKSTQMSRLYEMDLYFKKDFLQATGSFKERGARNVLMKLLPDQKKLGVIAASAGNHALAMAYHGQELGIPVTVVMPLVAPLMKVSLCRTYGANVIVLGAHIGQSKEYAMHKAAEEGLMYVNGYDHIDILAGAGTIGLEILEDCSKVDAVVIPVGGGGLIAGIACAIKYLKPEVTIIGVEAEMCPGFKNAMEAGKPTYTTVGSTLADGLSVPIVGVNSFETAKKLIDKMVAVSEKDIARAILRLIEMEKAVVEGAGAVGLAAILSGQLPELKGKRVVVPLCGGNIDTTVLGRTIERGLGCENRLIQVSVTVSDRPGGIAELTAILAKTGASIKDIFHERAFMKLDIFAVRLRVMLETRDKTHADEVEETLKEHYKNVKVTSEYD